VIVGGVAAALHGGSQVTSILDIVPSLAPPSWESAVDLLWSLGARPRIPETLERIPDAEHVREWRREKGMLALTFRAPDGSIDVDLLVGESDRFDALRSRAVRVALGERHPSRIRVAPCGHPSEARYQRETVNASVS